MDTLEMLMFNLKLVGRKSKKNILISVGKDQDKEKLLPHIKKLSKLPNISIYATEGTGEFLEKNQVSNQPLYKIIESKEPNIKSFLEQDRLDLVICIPNVEYYDEKTDRKLIKSLSIENMVPLITDTYVAILTIEELLKRQKKVQRYRIFNENQPWNMKLEFFQLVSELGGLACYHAHFDKAYLINRENLKLSQIDMQKKWELYKYIKENYTHDDLIQRMSRGVEYMIQQGVTHCRTFVDADEIAKLLPVKTAIEVKEIYKDKIKLEIGVQPLQGVLDSETRKYFIKACEYADIIGGLPSRDRPLPEKHLDFILSLAKDIGKKVDIHVDQENNPYENETELVALKTIEHGLEGKVSGIHCISLSAKQTSEQDRIIKIIKDAGINVIICPSAGISMKILDMPAPLHNSIAPVVKLLEHDVPVLLGVDNIYDFFMPMVDGDIWTECRFLMESCRYYDIEKIAQIACNKIGFITN